MDFRLLIGIASINFQIESQIIKSIFQKKKDQQSQQKSLTMVMLCFTMGESELFLVFCDKLDIHYMFSLLLQFFSIPDHHTYKQTSQRLFSCNSASILFSFEMEQQHCFPKLNKSLLQL